MRRHAWLFVLAALVAVGKAIESPPNARGTFDLRIRGQFLEPGPAPARAPLTLSDFRRDPSGGVTATAAAWFAPAEVAASPDLSRLDTRPRMHDDRLPAWDLWRHRHGYTLGPARRAAWNGLGDEPDWMSPADAEFYDAYLIALYRLWTRRALRERLAGAEEPPPEPAPAGEAVVSIPMQYDETGLAEPVSASFLIHQWNLPVQVGFSLIPSTATHPAEWWFDLRTEPFVRYDKDAWRRRHGYRKTLFGYRWDADFPGGKHLGTDDGERLDALMERGVAFWANAALQRGLFELDQQLKTSSEAFRRSRYPSTGGGGPALAVP